ncbi:hypothetical protein Sked_33390 [Sanguibacter keddieii DSM 10542]|uniref:DUF3800 domain-containing protein n=1 Tax=Sanguibacter keddieii (strain ATCC 51767 / DSM 10542 / NCFB 3025 / ST-74) TaxID=446469 RepID=D1BE13_SANKS|nr:DUF3800 domain-containing protein [Sanguibacter keddieii]ACZ23234.1 hypothetical protein Sked_33390 [Sanguibacter keddieii DSM 10542]
MLIAYLDEFGHIGPYIEDGHKKFGHHPVFGYAGFVLPANNARRLGSAFKKVKTSLFRTEIESSATPAQWERKGSEYFSTGSIQKYPGQVRAFTGLVRQLKALGGQIFYYGDEKQRGTLAQTGREANVIALDALKQTIDRLCTHADRSDDDLLILMDAITDKTRRELVAKMYAHIYGRDRQEMRRIVEAPLHIESNLNSGVQLADWICALITRSSHYQLVEDSPFGWAPRYFADHLQGMFTYESKLHLLSGPPVHHSSILRMDPVSCRPELAGNLDSRTVP